MRKNIIKIIAVSFLLLSINCAVEETDEQSILKSYRTLTPVTVTTGLINQILDNLNQPELNDNQIRQLIIFPVKVYEITYRTNYKGQEILASGAVFVPEASGAFPILNYYHGTIFKDSRAPSNYNGSINMEAETAMNMIFASTGFICASPDLIGYGDSTEHLHPYHLFYPSVSASLDMMRAVKELLKKIGMETDGTHFITGYSEGAYSGMAVQREIQQKYAGEFPLTASSLGAGAYHLSETISLMINVSDLVSPAYIAFLITSYNDYYGWGRDLSSVFNKPYSDHIASGILNGDLTQSEINGMLSSKTSTLFTASFLSDFRGSGEDQLKAAFLENDLISGWAPSIPTRLYHGTWDTVVPKMNSQNAFNSFLQQGSAHTAYITLNKKDHETAIIPWIRDTILWFNSISN